MIHEIDMTDPVHLVKQDTIVDANAQMKNTRARAHQFVIRHASVAEAPSIRWQIAHVHHHLTKSNPI